MSCVSDFTINKGVDNIFTFVIKQTGTTMPMEIVNNEIRKTKSITPVTSYVPYVPEVKYVPAKPAVTAHPGQEYIPTVEGKTENYHIFANGLNTGKTYSIQINTIVISLAYNSATHVNKYDYLNALRNLINANATISALLTATVDENILKLTGKTKGTSYTVNGSDAFTIVEVQTAVQAVAGQSYIAPREYSPAVPEVPYRPAIDPHYIATNQALSVDLTDLLNGLNIQKIEIQPEVAVKSVKVGNTTINLVNGWYNLQTSKIFTVTPIENTDKLDKPLPSIELRIKVTLTDTIDKFYLKLFDIENGEMVLAIDSIDETVNGSKIEIEDAANGKIQVILKKEDVENLEVERGDKVDRYYLRPNYRLLIDCDTVNNGMFSAKLDYIYVE